MRLNWMTSGRAGHIMRLTAGRVPKDGHKATIEEADYGYPDEI